MTFFSDGANKIQEVNTLSQNVQGQLVDLTSGSLIKGNGNISENLLVSTGELTADEAKYHPRKNVLMRALGANNPIDIDIFDVEPNIDGILLCSDGLTNMLTQEQIEKVLGEEMSAEETVKKLINKANARGGNDNISVAYLKNESGDV